LLAFIRGYIRFSDHQITATRATCPGVPWITRFYLWHRARALSKFSR
jgi:hypothetical protein